MKVWRFVGFDDGFGRGEAYIVGCVTAGSYVEGFMVDRIEVDGMDVTEKIVGLVSNSKFRVQLKCIFLYGITFAGFNVADIEAIHRETGIPVVVVMRRKPRFGDIERAVRNLENWRERLDAIRRAGDVCRVEGLYVQFKGCSEGDVRDFLRASRLKGKVPEALRIAHLVASAIVYGESKRK